MRQHRLRSTAWRIASPRSRRNGSIWT